MGLWIDQNPFLNVDTPTEVYKFDLLYTPQIAPLDLVSVFHLVEEALLVSTADRQPLDMPYLPLSHAQVSAHLS